jgi:hypothetical protein
VKRAATANLLVLLCCLVSAEALAQAANDCVPAINGALKGGPGNIQDHMFHSLAIDPTNHNVVYAGTETNGIEISESNPNVVWAAAKGYYLYRSTDAGQTWTKITAVRDAVYSAQGVNGNLYAVVAPLYVTPPFLSYLRLFNGGGATATFTVTVVGSGTATAYGTASYIVGAAATRQLSMSTILVDAGAVNRNAADALFSFYIQSPEALAGYQHVTLNATARYFGNASVCSHTIQDVMREASSQVVLPSIHTSRLAAAGYPSQIELHNYANTATTYRFSIRDEESGSLIGQMDFPTRPNASYTILWSQIESQIGFNPTAAQIRANLFVTEPSGAPPQIVLGQMIVNNAVSVLINLTSACAVNRPAAN